MLSSMPRSSGAMSEALRNMRWLISEASKPAMAPSPI
jgi:hypothetical protein